VGNSYIRKATIQDANHVALNMREADKNEVMASDGELPVPAVLRAYNRSDKCLSLIIDDEAACVFGVAPLSLLGSVGSPWMLGTDLITKNPLTFLRKSQNVVLDMQKSYATLINYIDSRNEFSLAWAKWVGFDVSEDTELRGPFNMPFHRFELRK